MIFMKNICFKRYIYENDKFENFDKKKLFNISKYMNFF